jgi:glycosidase
VPWTRVNEDYTEWNAAQQVADPVSILCHWRRVLELRKQQWDVFIYGQFVMIDRDHPSILCYKRVGKTASATVVANFTDEDRHWSVPRETAVLIANGTTVLANYETPSQLHDGALSLRPYESFVVLREKDTPDT